MIGSSAAGYTGECWGGHLSSLGYKESEVKLCRRRVQQECSKGGKRGRKRENGE